MKARSRLKFSTLVAIYLCTFATARDIVDAIEPAAVTAGSGSLAWTLNGRMDSVSLLCRADGSIVMVKSGAVRIFDQSGIQITSFQIAEEHIMTIADGPEGILYLRGAYGLMAVYEGSGDVLWYNRSIAGEGMAVGIDGTIYLPPLGDRGLRAISPNGIEVWSVSLNSDAHDRGAPVILANGTIVVPEKGGLAFVTQNGKISERITVDGLVGHSLALGPDDTIYCATSRDTFEAFQPDGSPKWVFEFGSISDTPKSPSILPDGTIFISAGSNVWVVSKEGELVSRVWLSNNAGPSHVDGDGKIYVGTSDGELVATLPNGLVSWKHPIANSATFYSPAGLVLAEGTGGFADRIIATRTGAPAAGTWLGGVGPAGGSRRSFSATSAKPVLSGMIDQLVVEPGATFTLRSQILGNGPFSGVWSKDGETIPGATSAQLTISAATPLDSGDYVLTVSNSAGSTQSKTAEVVVRPMAVGETSWAFPYQSATPPVVANDGRAVFAARVPLEGGSSQTYWVCLDRSGNELWRSPAPRDPSETCMLDDGGFLFLDDRRLTVLNTDGSDRWSRGYSTYEIDGYFRALALAQDGGIVVHSERSLAKVSAKNGDFLWVYHSQDFHFNRPSFGVAWDGTVVVEGRSAGHGISSDGTALWTVPGLDAFKGFLDADVGVFDSSHGHMVIDLSGQPLDRDTGLTGPILVRPDGGLVGDGWMRSPDGRMIQCGDGTAVAVDQENNIWVDEGSRLVAFDAEGIQFLVVGKDQWIDMCLTRTGHLVGGSPFRCVKAVAPLAESIWPMPSGNPARNNRMPKVFGAVPVILDRTVATEVRTGATLRLRVDLQETEPVVFSWEKDGVVLYEEEASSLVIDDVTGAVAGSYRVKASYPGGEATSIEWMVDILPPVTFAGIFRADLPENGLVLAEVTPAGRLAIVAGDGQHSFIVRNIDVTNGDARFPIGTVEGTVRFTPDGNTMELTVADGEAHMLTRVSGEQIEPTAIGLHRGGPLGRYFGELNLILGGDGVWVWVWTDATGSFGGRGDAPPAVGDIRRLTGTFSGAAEFRGTLSTAEGIDYSVWAGRPISGSQGVLRNISTRGQVDPAGTPIIAGFVTVGDGEQPLLVRGVGPGLVQFGVEDAVESIEVELIGNSNSIAVNRYWWTSLDAETLRARTIETGAFPLGGLSLDSALLQAVPAGPYTAQIRPVFGRQGVALVEIFEAGQVEHTSRRPRIVNLSTRGHASHDARTLIAGFVLEGDVPVRLLVRAIGPALAAFQVPDAASDTDLTLFHEGGVIASNDDWVDEDDYLEAAFSEAGAFPLGASTKDAAIIVLLEPGIYTAMVTAGDGSAGTALVEVYELPR